MNNRLIYTCITGGYDTPTDDFIKKPGYDYILISDQHIETNSWKCIVLSFEGMDNLNSTKKQRYVKTHPHELFKEYDVIVWIDANTSINNALYDYIEKGKLIGEVKGKKLYMVFSKDGKYLNYKDYI